ncbi:MAG: type VI secretion system ATPase TssH, partial [Eubacterium sp.]|nr:type VI secretion system ATPase TssH [Eubacterium sp.]
LTSNLGSQYLLEGIGEDGEFLPDTEKKVMGDLRNYFRPEFLNRLDETILFKPLSEKEIGSIVELLMADLNRRLADKELAVELTDAAKEEVVRLGYDPIYGARPLKRFLQKNVETLVARAILQGSLRIGDTITIDAVNGELRVKQ